jgi:hypothetical protein
VSLITTAETMPVSLAKITLRGANARRIAYHSGLGRPSESIAAHEVTGQQSLSCQTIAPAVLGYHRR